MDTWVWIVIAAAVIVVAGIAWMVVRRRRTTVLRERFGPEYERAVSSAGNRVEAEHDLRDRARERDQLELRELTSAARARYVEEWQALQTRFVDHPSVAVAEADALVVRVMEDRGYPVSDFEAQAALVSVDHPNVVENYRFAHGVFEQNQGDRASTEDLRDALVRYRSLFDELLDNAPDIDVRAPAQEENA